MEIKEKIKSLKSIWGLLTGSIILFPGFSYLINIADIKLSELTGYYIGFSTVISLLALLYILSFVETNKNDMKIRKVVILSGIIAFILFSSFIVVKKTFIYDKNERIESVEKNEIIGYSYSKSGLVKKEIINKNENQIVEVYINKFEIVSLLLFVLSILSFTISFSLMGIYHYFEDKK